MDWKKIVGWFFVALGVIGMAYSSEVSDTACVLTAFMGFYLLVNSEKKK